MDAVIGQPGRGAIPREQRAHVLLHEIGFNRKRLPCSTCGGGKDAESNLPETQRDTLSHRANPERARLFHEALFMGAPLGFALHGIGTNQNLPLEIEPLICRLLVALLGAPRAAYVTSPINARQRHGLTLT